MDSSGSGQGPIRVPSEQYNGPLGSTESGVFVVR
jgi:hypothetical protein